MRLFPIFVASILAASAAAQPHAERWDGEVDPFPERAEARAFEPDPVLAWNVATLDLIRRARAFPPTATGALAIVHLAIHDATMAANPIAESYLGTIQREGPMSVEAGVTTAARTVLSQLFPSEAAAIAAEADARLALVSDGPEKAEGVRVGLVSAQRMLAARVDDGATTPATYPGGTDVGEWRPTRPDFRPALLPNWPNVRPFFLVSGDEFRLPPPPAVASDEYAIDQEEVRLVGDYFSAVRTSSETMTAIYWADGPGTFTPPGHWNALAAESARAADFDTAHNAWLFALLNASQADAAIACWDVKYAYGLWRPITSIPLAGTDGNPATQATEGWTSFLYTPQFPEYPSGHSTFSGAAAEILESFFGTTTACCAPSDGLELIYGVPDETRCWGSFAEAASEAGDSRILGGIHFRFSKTSGLLLGRNVAREALDRILRERPGQSESWVLY